MKAAYGIVADLKPVALSGVKTETSTASDRPGVGLATFGL